MVQYGKVATTPGLNDFLDHAASAVLIDSSVDQAEAKQLLGLAPG
jgi:hypothetical protein